MNDFGRLIEFNRDGSVEALLFHPDQGRHIRTGRFDGDQTLHFDDGEQTRVEVAGPHLLYLDGHPHRRILDDGTVVDYPRTVRGRFARSPGAMLLLDEDGSLTHETTCDQGRVAERGSYDLHRGFARTDSWGRHRGILLMPDGDLRLGQAEYRRME